jgi:hypothetical protein
MGRGEYLLRNFDTIAAVAFIDRLAAALSAVFSVYFGFVTLRDPVTWILIITISSSTGGRLLVLVNTEREVMGLVSSSSSSSSSTAEGLCRFRVDDVM